MAEEQNQEEQEEEKVDYKAKYEEANQKVEKISNSYKDVEKDRNQLRSVVTKNRKAIEDNGLGRFDEEWNLQLDVTRNTGQQSSPTDNLQAQIDALDTKFDEGNIDDKAYYKQLSSLQAEIKTEEKMSQFYAKQETDRKKQEKLNQANQAETTKTQTHATLRSELDGAYPDHNNEQSDLYKEMNRIASASPSKYPDPNNDMLDRSRLVDVAVANLRVAGKVIQARTQANDVNFRTLNSSPYDASRDEDQSNIGAHSKTLLINAGYDDKTIKTLDKMFNNYDQTQSVTVES